MLKTLVADWFKGIILEDRDDYTLYWSSPGKTGKAGLFTPRAPGLVLVCMKTDIVNFEAMASVLLARAEITPGRFRRVSFVWLVVSPRGGIYLHETISRRENIRYPGMRNRFVVFNSDDGSFSFGPGHPRNREYTDKMRDLLSRSKVLDAAKFSRLFGGIMNSALERKGLCDGEN